MEWTTGLHVNFDCCETGIFNYHNYKRADYAYVFKTCDCESKKLSVIGICDNIIQKM
jgi:hypothetical protein